MRGFYEKLCLLKRDLSVSNKEVFGNIFQKVEHTESLYNMLSRLMMLLQLMKTVLHIMQRR